MNRRVVEEEEEECGLYGMKEQGEEKVRGREGEREQGGREGARVGGKESWRHGERETERVKVYIVSLIHRCITFTAHN